MPEEADDDELREEQARRLRQARQWAGFKSARAAATKFGWGAAGYTHHENGTRPLTQAFRKYAKAFRVSEPWLRCWTEDPHGAVRGAPIIYEAAMGVWREASASRKRVVPVRGQVDIPTDLSDDADFRFAVLVADASMDKIMPEGAHAICEPLPARDYKASDFSIGDLLFIERERNGAKEHSLRRVSHISGEKMKLSTFSTKGQLHQEFGYPTTAEKVRFIGRVTGKYETIRAR